jgi:DNA-binding PadR family transcriptional regulator
MYAYELSKTVQTRFDFTPATVTVYVVLYKMQREGLIQRGEERPVKGRPTRKYYQITDAGREAYRRGLAFLATTLRRLETPPPEHVADATPRAAASR